MKIDDYEFDETPQEIDTTDSEDLLSDLTSLLIRSEEPLKKLPKGKVDARRQVEEILLERRYKEIYGDPFEELSSRTNA